MDLQNLKEHLDQRIDDLRSDVHQVAGKLDSFGERIVKLETDSAWVHGAVRVGGAVLLAIVTAAVLAALKLQ